MAGLFWTNYCQRAHLLCRPGYFVPHKRRFIMADRVNISRTVYFFKKRKKKKNDTTPCSPSVIYKGSSPLGERGWSRRACRLDMDVYEVAWHHVHRCARNTRNCRSFVSRYRGINARDCIIRENFWEPIGGRLIARERREIS